MNKNEDKSQINKIYSYLNKKILILLLLLIVVIFINCSSCSFYATHLYYWKPIPSNCYYYKIKYPNWKLIIRDSIENCFSADQLKDIEKQIKKQRRIKCQYFGFGREAVYNSKMDKNDSCVGLFYLWANNCEPRPSSSYYLYFPCLKFTDKIEINFNMRRNNNKSKEEIEEIINGFTEKYSGLFEEKELKKMIEDFRNGYKFSSTAYKIR